MASDMVVEVKKGVPCSAAGRAGLGGDDRSERHWPLSGEPHLTANQSRFVDTIARDCSEQLGTTRLAALQRVPSISCGRARWWWRMNQTLPVWWGRGLLPGWEQREEAGGVAVVMEVEVAARRRGESGSGPPLQRIPENEGQKRRKAKLDLSLGPAMRRSLQ